MSFFSKRDERLQNCRNERPQNRYYCPNCYRFVDALDASRSPRCPNCSRILPTRLSESGYLPIALVASKEAGKSHFIGVLVEEINRLSSEFGWSFIAENDEIRTLYKKRFYEPLYRDKTTIEGTQTQDIDGHAPLIYSLRKGDKTTSVILYDAAGERFDAEEEMAKRRLDCARGIVLLIDPLQIPEMRDFLLQRDPTLVHSAFNVQTPIKEVMERMVGVLRRKYWGDKIPIPLAVVFTKIDALRRGVTDDAPFYNPSLHRGGFSASDGARIHEYVRRLTKNSVNINQYCDEFQYVAYFGVSALGQAPLPGGRLQFKPRPIRVVDPFLWFLRLAGTIEKID